VENTKPAHKRDRGRDLRKGRSARRVVGNKYTRAPPGRPLSAGPMFAVRETLRWASPISMYVSRAEQIGPKEWEKEWRASWGLSKREDDLGRPRRGRDNPGVV